MGMHILQADLTADIGCLLCPAEDRTDAAFVAGRAVHQAYAIRTFKMLVDQAQIGCGLCRIHQFSNNTAGHRQQAVMDSRLIIFRMEHILDGFSILEISEAGNNLILNQQGVEGGFHLLSHFGKTGRELWIECCNLRQVADDLERQGHCPRTDEPGLQCFIGRLQGIIPVAPGIRKKGSSV
ncbi:hypothetical protein D3C75_976590 [compost metagenome]